MDWNDKVAFYEKQKASWAGVRELCEAGASRVVDSERLERIQHALQLAAKLESEANAMLHNVQSQAAMAPRASA